MRIQEPGCIGNVWITNVLELYMPDDIHDILCCVAEDVENRKCFSIYAGGLTKFVVEQLLVNDKTVRYEIFLKWNISQFIDYFKLQFWNSAVSVGIRIITPMMPAHPEEAETGDTDGPSGQSGSCRPLSWIKSPPLVCYSVLLLFVGISLLISGTMLSFLGDVRSR